VSVFIKPTGHSRVALLEIIAWAEAGLAGAVQ